MTIAQIEQQLLTAASNNDMATITTLISGLTATQKGEIHATVFDTVLQSVALYSNTHASANATLLTFMKDVGAYTDPTAIATALENTSGGNNYAATADIVDNIAATQKSGLVGLVLDQTLQNLAVSSAVGPNASQATGEVQDFMTHLGAYVSPVELAGALEVVSAHGDFAATASIIDNISLAQKSGMTGSVLDQTLQNLAIAAAAGTTGATTEVQDFMTHLGAYASPVELASALETVSAHGDFASTAAIVDNIAAAQKSGMVGSVLDQALQNIALSAAVGPNAPQATAEVQDFMTHLGAYVSPVELATALENTSGGNNYAATASIVDNIATAQKSGMVGSVLDQTLQNLALSAAVGPNATQATAEVQDFMTHLGAFVSPVELAGALEVVSAHGNFAATASIIDNIAAAQKSGLGGSVLDQTLQNLAIAAAEGTTGATAEVQDFMTHLGAYVSPVELATALENTSGGSNFAATASIVDNITTAQESGMVGSVLDQTLQNIALSSAVGPNAPQATAEVQDFMTHLGAYVSPIELAGALEVVSAHGDFAATASIIDNITTAQKPGMTGSVLDQTLQNLAMEASVGASGATAEVQDFMTHLGANTDAFAIGGALDTVTGGPTPNFAAAADIIDNVTATQAPAIGGQALITALQNLVLPASTLPSSQHAATAEVQDFMTHLGAYTPIAAIDNAVTQLADSPNTAAGLGAVLDNLTTTQWNNLSNLPANLGSGKSLILGTNGNDVIHANANTHGDAIFGGDGSDTLVGGAGSDLLVGGGSGTGTNTLTGGAGADTFLLDRIGSTNVVTDFSKAQGDILDLTDVLHVANPASVAIGQFVSFTVSGGNTHVEVSANGTGSNWVEATQLTGVTGLIVAGLFTNHEIIV